MGGVAGVVKVWLNLSQFRSGATALVTVVLPKLILAVVCEVLPVVLQ